MRSNGNSISCSNLFDASLLNFSRLMVEAAFFVTNANRLLTRMIGIRYISSRIY